MVHIWDMSSGKLTVSKTYSMTSGRRVPCITAKPRMRPQFQKLFFVLNHKTRMHSSRMRTTHLLTVSRSAQWGICLGVVCLGGASAQGDVCPMACWDTPPPVDRILDTRLWKHYHPATTVPGGNYMASTLDETLSHLRKKIFAFETFMSYCLKCTKEM